MDTASESNKNPDRADEATGNDIDWQALFFAPEPGHTKRLEARARRRFGVGPDAESAYDYALERLSADDWQRLRAGYRGRGSPDGFLAITFNNLMEEYAVRKYGRRRPPVWVQRLGGVWPRIYEMLCLRRQSPEQIVATICARQEHEPAEIRRAVKEVGGRIPDCGRYTGESNLSDDFEPALDQRAGGAVDDELQADQLTDLLGALSAALEESLDAGAEEPASQLALHGDALNLEAEERLLLQLVYREGYSIAKAARALRLHEQKTRRMHKAVVGRLRNALAAAGFG